MLHQNDSDSLTYREKVFLKFIKEGLQETPQPIDLGELSREDCVYLCEEGQRQSLQAVLYHGMEESAGDDESILWDVMDLISKEEIKKTLATYSLYKEMNGVVNLLEKEGFSVVVLKGPTVGAFYPMPEFRKSGDVDLWLLDVDAFDERFEGAAGLLEKRGYLRDKETDSIYHVGFCNHQGLEVELHIKPTGTFQNQNLNRVVEEFAASVREKPMERVEILNRYEFPTLSGADLLYYNLLHMLHHFTTKGFGWKFVCDWAMMLKEKQSRKVEQELYVLLEKSRLLDFAETISLLAVEYLGLDRKNVEFLISGEVTTQMVFHLARELFAAGELGREDKYRMLRPENASWISMAKLFHLQMKKNYPKASMFFVFWPALWLATFFRFSKNNRRLRGVSTIEVLKEAKHRGKMTESLILFKR